ncbi:MAG: sel1 repeat family protein, partial [Verrucomicrobia bacterium]|nr:sel1 repeat family protein [Verrucomicrobiota bacterium]
MLGTLYDQGEGVPADLREAVKWYELAAAQGLPDAQYNLAICYSKGEGVAKKDLKIACEWFRRAALQGDAQSQSRLGLAYISGSGVERDRAE